MQIWAFASVIVVSMFTPGPNIVMVVQNARSEGFAATRPLLAGMSFGYGLIVFCACVFNLFLVRILPAIRPYIGALAALYLLWLAVRMFLPKKSRPAREGAAGRAGVGRFVTGVLLQFVNPKVILNNLAVTAAFILPHFDSAAIFAAFAVGLGSLCAVSLSCWAFFGALFQRFFSSHETVLNVVMAMLLAYCAWSVLAASISG
ncbi:LysE family transporter [Synergistaceae bacterium OttesenSCG-928-I11]|nr:LysE family transporter [Synergistaceae bacterium OttesenSCG-928-I11]